MTIEEISGKEKPLSRGKRLLITLASSFAGTVTILILVPGVLRWASVMFKVLLFTLSENQLKIDEIQKKKLDNI